MAKRSSAITRAHLDSDLLIKTIVRGNGRCVRDCPSSGFSRTLCGVIGSEFGLGAMVVLAGTQSRGSASHGVRIRCVTPGSLRKLRQISLATQGLHTESLH